MTATLSPPRPAQPTPENAGSTPPPPLSAKARAQALLIAEIATALLTLTAVLGLRRLFEDWSFLPDLLLVAAAAHTTAIAARRMRAGPIASLLLVGGGGVLVLSWLLLPETLTYGLPTGSTLDVARTELSDAWSIFNEIVAPAPVEPGFVLASAIAIWIVAVVADTAMFRLRTPAEGAVPAGTLFVFAAALGAAERRVLLSGLFFAAVLLYMLANRAVRQASAAHALGLRWGRAPAASLRRGAVVGGAALLAAVVVGPSLPGAGDRAVIPWRNSDRAGGGTRVTVSPLVEIKKRLVTQSTVEVFSVKSSERAYWRLTALDVFNGSIWSSRGSYKRADGGLPDAIPRDVAVDGVRQTFTVSGLASPWLPAAYRPAAVHVDGDDVRYDAESGSILADEDTSDGLTYRVESAIPRLDRSDLAPVPPDGPADLVSRYTELPDTFPPRVTELARAIVARATSPYERALFLQQWLRETFTYSLEVNEGHGTTAIEHFLFESRTGYCEQFAGSFAAMARAVDLPARVAVGFTPGERDAEGVYHVLGAHAHAWPEVYLDGYGWVAFEPTPGRGIPGATPYTGVDEQQADLANPGSATTLPAPPSTAPTESTTPPSLDFEDLAPEGDAADGTGGDEGVGAWIEGFLVMLATAATVLAVWMALITAVTRVRRDRRRAVARSPAARATVAWVETREMLERAGVTSRRWETNDELAARAAHATGIDDRLLRGMAGIASAAQYSPAGVTDEAVRRATAGAGAVARAVNDTLSWRERLRWMLDPRPLLPSAQDRLVVHVVRAQTGS